MKAVIVFLVVIILGFGFVQFISWLVAEPPMHVFHAPRSTPGTIEVNSKLTTQKGAEAFASAMPAKPLTGLTCKFSSVRFISRR